jgi:GNAT superfamily N-acetyltransferase
MRITSNPKPEHLIQIKSWLYEEHTKNINGFYGNYCTIKEGFDNKKLLVVIHKELAIGYCVFRINGKTAELSIANIKSEYKRKGVGRKLSIYLESKLIKKGVKAIDLKCSPSNSRKIWKKLGFKDLKEVENHNYLQNSNSPYLYKILTEIKKPTKSKANKNIHIELYCNDPIKSNTIPNYIWEVNPKTIVQKPIIYPVDPNWNIKFYRDEKLIIETKIKRFCKGEFLKNNFMIVDKMPYDS